MSDRQRHTRGLRNDVDAAVDSGTVIEIGDLLWQDIDDAKPASDLLVTGGESRAERFAAKFLGVTMQRSRNGDTAPIRLATTGVFEFDCVSDTFELGDFITPVNTVVGLCNQTVRQTERIAEAIGRVAKREASPATSVLIEVRSTVMTGGVAGSSREGV